MDLFHTVDESSKVCCSASQQSSELDLSQRELLYSLTDNDTPYLCPGENLPINRSVHLARLRSHYLACKHCPHRLEAEQFSENAHQQLQTWWNHQGKERAPLEDGFRNDSGFQLSAQTGAQLSQSYAVMLWEQVSNRNTKPTLTAQTEKKQLVRPTIVMGHDGSESTLELSRDAVRSVQEQGGQIVDVGGVTPSCMQFVIQHLEADGGIHAISMDSSDPQIGLDFYGNRGIPLSGESLYKIQTSLTQKRYARSDGGITPFPARKAYLGTLCHYFQNLSPVRLGIKSSNRLVIDLLRELFQETPIEFVISEEQIHNHSNSLFVDELRKQQCDLGAVIDHQGQSVAFFDEEGNPLSASEILLELSFPEQADRKNESAPTLLLGEELDSKVFLLEQKGNTLQIRSRQSFREYFARGMQTAEASVGYDVHQRYWFREPDPVCDGIITLAKVLSLFPFSG